MALRFNPRVTFVWHSAFCLALNMGHAIDQQGFLRRQEPERLRFLTMHFRLEDRNARVLRSMP